MYYHMFPPESEQGNMACTCEWGQQAFDASRLIEVRRLDRV